MNYNCDYTINFDSKKKNESCVHRQTAGITRCICAERLFHRLGGYTRGRNSKLRRRNISHNDACHQSGKGKVACTVRYHGGQNRI